MDLPAYCMGAWAVKRKYNQQKEKGKRENVINTEENKTGRMYEC